MESPAQIAARIKQELTVRLGRMPTLDEHRVGICYGVEKVPVGHDADWSKRIKEGDTNDYFVWG